MRSAPAYGTSGHGPFVTGDRWGGRRTAGPVAALAAAWVAAALAVAGCSPHPRTAQDFRDVVSKPVDTAHSVIETVDLTLEQVGRGNLTDNLATVTLADAAEELQKELRTVEGYPARGADDLKARVVGALQQAVAVAEQVKDGVDRQAATAIRPVVRDASDGLDRVSQELPPPDKVL